jgi:osmoprotectant transport system permease protein
MKSLALLVAGALGSCTSPPPEQPAEPVVTIGSKTFTESVILGEVAAQLIESTGARAVHRRGIGGTGLLWLALRGGEIDVYPDYTGTISQEILVGKGARSEAAIRDELAKFGIRMSRPLGFNNTYALGMKKPVAERFGIHKLSDLARHPDLRFGFTNEFMTREDGWPSLRDRYQLPQRNVTGLEHVLAYQALENGTLDATDLYSTDAEIRFYDLAVLDDDLRHFPDYKAVLLYRADLADRAPDALAALLRLEGAIGESVMIEMNARTMLDKVPESQVAAVFVREQLGLRPVSRDESFWQKLLTNAANHLLLVAASLGAAILVAVPLGIIAARRPRIGQTILGVAGILQTIPSLALLLFVVALLGGRLGAVPAITALFLYSLLPIVRNTYTGLHDIPPPLIESAEALGLAPGARLRLIELPLASRTILAGIKTAAVINVGNATLGGFIGAGGFGQPIFEGLRRFNFSEVFLQGAIPAALLALVVQSVFDIAERLVVPKGLRVKSELAD